MRNRNLYPENWEDEIRPRILIRDGYKCTRCRIKHRSFVFIDQNHKIIIVDREEHIELREGGYKTYRVYLQVAHRNHDKSNCTDENLFTLCPKCHNDYDKQHKAVMRIARLAAGMPNALDQSHEPPTTGANASRT